MLSPSDFVFLPYTQDLTQAGIQYAVRSLAHTYNRMGGGPANRLRRIVGGKAVELAFRRHLIERNVPFDNLGSTPFTDPDHYDISLGGRRCDLKSFLIYQRERIHRLQRQPETLMQTSALVPADQLAASHFSERDIYIFAFSAALVTRQAQEVRKALQAGQPAYFIHAMPPRWSQPVPWGSLGELSAKSAASYTVEAELGGQLENHNFSSEYLALEPLTKSRLASDFFSLAYLHVAQLPDGQLGVHSPRLKQTYLVDLQDWDNIWVYGIQIILAGWITRSEFRRRAQYLPAGRRVYQYARTRTPNWALALSELNPIKVLFDQVKDWAR